MKDDVNKSEKLRLTDVGWLFLVMHNFFGLEWLRCHASSKRKSWVMRRAEREWGRIIHGFSRDELRRAVHRARKLSDIPPSRVDFWRILESQRINDRQAAQQRKKKHPPNRALGAAMLQATKSFLEKPETNVKEE